MAVCAAWRLSVRRNLQVATLRSGLFLTALTFLLQTYEIKAQESLSISGTALVDDACVIDWHGGTIQEQTNYGDRDFVRASSWTKSSQQRDYRSYVKFDMSGVPSGSTITSATITFRSNPARTSLDWQHVSHTSSNEMYLERVTQPWDEFGITWSTQPSVTPEGRIYVSESTQNYETRVIDIRTLTQYWLDHPEENHGFRMILVNEVYYASRPYASSEHATLYPVIDISYTLPEPERIPFSDSLSHKSLYNGNISAIRWQGASDSESQLYTFGYDGLNRLTSAHYSAILSESGGGYTHHKGYYSVPAISYDLNGNITGLMRQGLDADNEAVVIDSLAYTYAQDGAPTGNRLMSVRDAGSMKGFSDGHTGTSDYAYDANGNLTQDLNKGITEIDYNHLNLPTRVVFENGDRITYLYDAAGVKLQQKVYKDGRLHKTTDYVGAFIYETDTTGERKLQLIQHEEGRLIPKEQEPGVLLWDYQYHLKDHLGNVRVTFSTTPESYEIVENFEGDDHGFQDTHQHTDANRNTTEDVGLAEGTYGSNNKVSLLESGQTGAMVLIGVDARDTVLLTVNASYLDAPTDNSLLGTAYTTMFSSFGAAYPGNVEGLSGANLSETFDDALSGMANEKGEESLAPRAYLNYIYFDQDMTYQASGFKQVSAAAQATAAHQHEVVTLDEPIIAEEAGYVLAYLSNENQEPVAVYFDDFTVHHNKTNIVSTQDYYPGGGFFNSYTRTASTAQKFKYQNKEWENETQLYDFHARMYDPWLWRTPTMDGHAETYYDWSPYSWGGNNPTLNIDPSGMDWFSYTDDDGNESVIWRDASDETLDIDGNTYSNIGTSYSYRAGNTTFTFDQNNLSTIEEHVLDNEDWVSDRPNGTKTQECFDASCQMVNASGATPGLNYPSNRIVLGSERLVTAGYSVFPRTDGQSGQSYLDSQVDQGRSVLLGIDWKYGTVNSDGITDHWVALSSRVTNVSTGAVSYKFFDPGTQHSFKGTNPQNILQLQSGMFRGTYYGKIYDLSAIRRNTDE